MNSITKLFKPHHILRYATIQQKRGLFMSPLLLQDEEQSTGKEQPAEKEPLVEKEPSVEIKLAEELKSLNDKFKELQNSYLMSLADQENLRQRHKRELENAKEFAIQKFAKDLLDPLDILSVALNSVPKEYRDKKDTPESIELSNLYTGVSMTETEFKKTLKRFGVEEDDPLDQTFDPNKHEAVFQTAVPDKESGTIFVVQKKGYMLKNRVLRAAQVGVVANE